MERDHLPISATCYCHVVSEGFHKRAHWVSNMKFVMLLLKLLFILVSSFTEPCSVFRRAYLFFIMLSTLVAIDVHLCKGQLFALLLYNVFSCVSVCGCPTQIHTVHQSLRDLRCDQQRLSDDLDREILRRNRYPREGQSLNIKTVKVCFFVST